MKPHPPSFRTGKGWPWDTEYKSLPEVMPNGKSWPRISIVTPSYNQGQFLEETIRSVIYQNYPNLEYIVMDGGSTDNSVEIIEQYKKHLTYWVSEKDDGQADAINRGFEKASGDIIAWINSDDYYLKGALRAIAAEFSKAPEAELIVGGYLVIRENGKKICKYYSFPQDFNSLLCAGQLFGQMSCFWKKDVFGDVKGLDASLRFCFDYDLFLKLTQRKPAIGLNRIIATFRLHDHSKSSTIWDEIGAKEALLLQSKYGIESIPDNTRIKIKKDAMSAFQQSNARGLLYDFIFDFPFFLRSSAARLRDKILKPLLRIK